MTYYIIRGARHHDDPYGDYFEDFGQEPCTLPGRLIHQTQKAYLVRVADEKEVWLPKSKTTMHARPNEPDCYDFTIPVWVASDKAILGYSE